MKTLEQDFDKWIIKEVGIQDASLFSKGSLVRRVAIAYANSKAAEAKAEAWQEGFNAGVQYATNKHNNPSNPYTKEI